MDFCFWYVLLSGFQKKRLYSATFGRRSREPKFNIEFHSEDTPFHPNDDQESIVMPNSIGDKFLYFLPKVEKSKSGKLLSQHNVSSMIMESERQNKIKTPDELLGVLKDQCFIRQEGWWSYQFCHQNKLRQIHVDDDKREIQKCITLLLVDLVGKFGLIRFWWRRWI